jgi:hypothetical protein
MFVEGRACGAALPDRMTCDKGSGSLPAASRGAARRATTHNPSLTFRAVSPVDFRDKPIEHAASEPLAQRMLHGTQDKTCAA